MAPTLQTRLPSTRSGRTFFFALGTLGALALGQFIILAIYLLRGGIAARQAVEVHFAESRLSSPSTPATPNTSVPPLPPEPTPAPTSNRDAALAASTAAADMQPTPVARLQGGAGDLLEQARQLRARGDTNSALARLREAQVAEPDNPQLVAEMALTYEAMQIPDRAFEQWQRLYGMGEGIGALYYLADTKLHAAPATAASSNPRGGNNSQAGGNEPADNGLLKLADIHKEEVSDAGAEQKVVLNIVVKSKQGTVIDPNKVRILTFFYDLVDGKDVVLTDAQTGYAWLTPAPVNWANDKSEVLETTYYRPKATPTPDLSATSNPPPGRSGKARTNRKGEAQEAASPIPSATPAQIRTYLGYTVRLYYDGQLQDAQGDPVRLLQQFPPPTTISRD